MVPRLELETWDISGSQQSVDSNNRGNVQYNVSAIIYWHQVQGLTTPNASPIETHVNCPNSAGRIPHFSIY